MKMRMIHADSVTVNEWLFSVPLLDNESEATQLRNIWSLMGFPVHRPIILCYLHSQNTPTASAKLLNLPASLLYDVHWLPINSRIQYKIALICCHIISGTASPHLSELFHFYTPSPLSSLSLVSRIFRVSWVGRRTLGEEILLVHWTCDLELSASLCQAFVFALFF